jgi:ribonucleotide reductase alpha subunit
MSLLFLNYHLHQKARALNKEIYETIYFNALRQSCDLAKATGLTYHHYEGSPISKGIFNLICGVLKLVS